MRCRAEAEWVRDFYRHYQERSWQCYSRSLQAQPKGQISFQAPTRPFTRSGPSRWIKPGGRSGTVGHKLVPPGQLIDACTRPHGSRTTGHREHDVAGSVAFTVDALAAEVTAGPPHAIHVSGPTIRVKAGRCRYCRTIAQLAGHGV